MRQGIRVLSASMALLGGLVLAIPADGGIRKIVLSGESAPGSTISTVPVAGAATRWQFWFHGGPETIVVTV